MLKRTTGKSCINAMTKVTRQQRGTANEDKLSVARTSSARCSKKTTLCSLICQQQRESRTKEAREEESKKAKEEQKKMKGNERKENAKRNRRKEKRSND